MAEATIDLPGAGPVKKQWVYIGLAGVAAVVGYAYWKRSQDGPTAPVEPGIDDYSGGLQTGSSGSTTGGLAWEPADPPDPDDLPPTTNAAWTQRAVSYLTQLNFDPQVAAIALGKYLAKLPLVPSEADIVRTALGAIGKPPVGEFNLIMVPNPPPGGTPPPPAGTPPPASGVTHLSVPLEKNLYGWVDEINRDHGTSLTFTRMFGNFRGDPTALNPDARKYMRWDGTGTKTPVFYAGWPGGGKTLGIPPMRIR